MLLKRLAFVLVGLLFAALTAVVLLNQRQEMVQIVSKYLVALLFGGCSATLLWIAAFATDDYVDTNVTWKKFWEHFPF